MTGGSDRKADAVLDGLMARLAAEASPGEALTARVLADAAMVAAERQPADQPVARPARAAAAESWFDRLVGGRLFGPAGAAAAMGLCLALGLGLGMTNDRAVLRAVDDSLLLQASEIDAIEDEVIAVAGEDLFGLDAPL